MMEMRKNTRRFIVRRAPLNADRALRHSRQHFLWRQRRRRTVLKFHAHQTGHRQHRRIGHPVGKLAQPRFDIAAKGHNRHIRTLGQNLRPAPERRRADDGILWQFGKARALGGNKRIARVFAFQNAVDDEPVGQQRRHVLHRMHGQIDAARVQRLFQLECKKPLAADFRQVAHLLNVALRLEGDDLAGHVRLKPQHATHMVSHHMRLNKGEFRPACTDAEAALHEGSLVVKEAGKGALRVL